ncbi:MAG: hypothetical protein KC613_09005, partial [Myxococcales bacterium]|nr:hypothetical protein [Myxococcales bacterium]
MRRNKALLVLAAVLGLALPAQAQFRGPLDPPADNNFRSLMPITLVFDIITAYIGDGFDPFDVSDQAIRDNNFPGRAFDDFDRDGDGLWIGDARNDTELAIKQFQFNPVDPDGDGLIGFYEIECFFASGGAIILEPDDPETVDGVDDGLVDCDGDGLGSRFEVQNGLNPLVAGTDATDDLDGDGINNSSEFNIGTAANTADTDGDGISDAVEVGQIVNGVAVAPLDSDQDGTIDALELDSDDDGIPDAEDECRTVVDAGVDTDGDGT